ncbi:MAG: hypothetical protein IT377_04205 [Polyangiaceae bacterium]|nr:hypothetical protein [Polyangiaceae bacterium]
MPPSNVVDVKNVRATDFATACKQDSDCVAVIEGDCTANRCANAAIHRSDFQRYRQTCTGTRDPLAECRFEVGERAICTAGRCSAEP